MISLFSVKMLFDLSASMRLGSPWHLIESHLRGVNSADDEVSSQSFQTKMQNINSVQSSPHLSAIIPSTYSIKLPRVPTIPNPIATTNFSLPLVADAAVGVALSVDEVRLTLALEEEDTTVTILLELAIVVGRAEAIAEREATGATVAAGAGAAEVVGAGAGAGEAAGAGLES